LRLTEDITEGIPKQSTLVNCRNCERYLSPPSTYVAASLESKELLDICLKKLKPSLSRVRFIKAWFIWTEPHSKRVKIKVQVQKQIEGNACLEQEFEVEFIVSNQMCIDCHRVEAKDFWKSSVQVRQKVTRKRTFYYLEQVLLKYNMHANTTKIAKQSNGLDFFYSLDQDAVKLKNFLMKILPCRYFDSKKLISHDTHNSTYNYKISYSVELPQVCKDDIVILPRKLANQLGNLGQLAICLRVTSNIHLIDFNTLQITSVPSDKYWHIGKERPTFSAICETKSLSHFTVMEIEPIRRQPHKLGKGMISKKHVLADCYVVRTSELGMTDEYIHCRTHLGHLLNEGDSVLGLDVANSNINNPEMDSLKGVLPDVILVKKVYDKQRRKRTRKWKLKRMANAEDTASITTDGNNEGMNRFIEDIEEDEEMRKHINIYANEDADHTQVETDLPQVPLEEMIQNMDNMNMDVEMKEENQENTMQE